MGERRVFTKAFKEESVRLAQRSGRSKTSIAEGLGITVNMLCLRKRESQKTVTDNNITAFSGHGNARNEEAARLRKENADLRETNEILKKQWPSSRKGNPDSVVSVYEAVSRTVPGYEDGSD